MERRVRVFRLKAEISGEHTLSREVFESLTLKHFPWHQPKDNHLKGAGEGNYYAVCPACTNPVQILGLYSPLPQPPPSLCPPHRGEDPRGLSTGSKPSEARRWGIGRCVG